MRVEEGFQLRGSRVSSPQLTQYDQWGKRVDDLQTSEGWRDLKAIAQKEGIPAIFYERKYKEHSRTYGFAKMVLMVGDTHVVFCPMSMTDGAARVIELIGTPDLKKELYPRLISRDPNYAFTSGQWMTERPGGSDVSQSETIASPTGRVHHYGPQYTLNGFKWFSSATDSEISVALARTGKVEDGSRGFHCSFNGIYVHRLKNKFGTRGLPTAELSLESTEGYLLGKVNEGVRNITPVLNITRLWSSIASIGNLRKCLAIATSYAEVRSIQGGKPFGAIVLLGKSECGVATTEELQRLRILTPVAKAFAAEKASTGMEEAMAALGGAGYMEENGFGTAIRDALVEKIWEGTSTVLALDLVRSAQNPGTMNAFISWAKEMIDVIPTNLKVHLQSFVDILQLGLTELATAYKPPMPPLIPHPALMLVGSIASSIYLLEHATWSYLTHQPEADIDIEVFKRWISEGTLWTAITDVKKVRENIDDRVATNARIVFGSSAKSKM
ncbi:acyl-CoA dehydrogenase/oxidase [Cyathus striatus]|nr:acyl-CoA dehydrogenase/oxidase [Cyathus striatus]